VDADHREIGSGRYPAEDGAVRLANVNVARSLNEEPETMIGSRGRPIRARELALGQAVRRDLAERTVRESVDEDRLEVSRS
jgi:hypothetical protein